ncbi:LOW QUALITY PROTEIN: hypothetical protein TorRG33x02_236300 [Trema orientale]|uniref:Uncharacterized protein n=1 Tax=Trema orientale TaxID=63057 RepID=A0A2P5E1E6_TREOI|nr:LOW QUALITY PROTEIN: hypothetical protein TorRG33x02_236300 [Trema orientale]
MLEVWGILEHWADSTVFFIFTPPLLYSQNYGVRVPSELRRKIGCSFTSGLKVNSRVVVGVLLCFGRIR